jgi:hypothetical protein
MQSARIELPHANRLGLDYAAEAARFPGLPFPIWDVHVHLSGVDAVKVFRQVLDLYGVGRVYSMSPLEEVDAITAVLGDRVRFIATPDFHDPDRCHALGPGYAARLDEFARRGARIAKFWSAPRGIDFAEQAGFTTNLFRLDLPHVQANMARAVQLGMVIMVHVADPDTWFATTYANTQRYGTKASQYEPLERCLEQFPVPMIAAHLGGWPEDLGFLSDLLTRHERLYLDTSATKWMVRELSRHEPSVRMEFFQRWRHRLLFGSDIVTRDGHLTAAAREAEDQKSSSAAEAFELYASRYWALRTLFETDYRGPSPIADPDLQLTDPQRYRADDAPELRGTSLPLDLLRSLYYDTAHALLETAE